MKYTMKQLAVGIMLGIVLVLPSLAIDQSFTIGSVAQATNFISVPCRVTQYTINNAGTVTNLLYYLIDAPATNLNTINATNGFFSLFETNLSVNIAQYLTNLVKTVTNFSGFTNIYSIPNMVYTYTNQVGATNFWATRASGVVASNSSITITPANPIHFVWGVSMTNINSGGGGTIVISYQPDL
jgi:hypothetical protein